MAKNNAKSKFKGQRRPKNAGRPQDKAGKTRNEACNTKEADIDRESYSHDNDASWYGASPKLLGDAGKISFNNPSGLPLNLSPIGGVPGDDSLLGNKMSNVTLPGIMTLSLCTGPGVSADNSSAVNVAARNLYSFIRHANSGHANYDAPDLMMYLLAVDNAYMWYSHMVRLYGTMMNYVTGNRYYPKAIVQSEGFNFDSIASDIPRLRFLINRYVKQIGSLCVPAELSLFKRHTWLYANYFADSSAVKSHLYMYIPAGFHLYEEKQGAGFLKWVPYNSLGSNNVWKTLDDIEKICNIFTEKLMTSEDIGIMSGDILKAYGQDRLLTLSMIPEDFSLLPSWSPEVLSQFHNATIVPHVSYDTTMDITQDIESGALLWKPHTATTTMKEDLDTEAALSVRQLLDLPMDDPSPDDVMVATRLKVMRAESGTTLLCGTEIVNVCSITTLNGSTMQQKPVRIGDYNMSTMAMLSMFKDHPTVVQYSYKGTPTEVQEITDLSIFTELANYTVITDNELKKLHEVAILSEFNVPQMGIYTP